MIAVREHREEFLRTIERLTAEREASREIVAGLRRSSSEVWDLEIPSEWRTAGFVQELTSVAYQIVESNPRQSLAFAQLALAIATGIPTRTYPSPIQEQIEGTAWKEIGTAHRYMGELDAALRAYDAAQRAYGRANALVHDSAVIELARAIVLNDLDRHDEALRILASIEPVLRDFEDHRHVVQVHQMTANIYYGQGRLQDAQAVLEKALAEVGFDDFYTRAAIHATLGLVYGKVGKTEEAFVKLHQARAMLADLGMTGEVTRTDWAIATTVLERGDNARAVEMLRAVRSQFLSLSIAHEAGLAGLDLADALIANGNVHEAQKTVEDVLREFTTANLSLYAIKALAYLRDILSTTQRPRAAVDNVRAYLRKLRSEPARIFLPPPEE